MENTAPLLAPHRDDDLCYLTTRGRVSGRPHEIEIWFALDGSTLFLLAGAGERSDWVRNLVAHSAVSVRVGDTTYAAHARVVEHGTDEDAWARNLVYTKYSRTHGDLDDWRKRSLPVALDVIASTTRPDDARPDQS